MSGQNFVLSYVQACASGRLPFTECGPMWQLAVIMVLLLLAVAVLVAIRVRPRARVH